MFREDKGGLENRFVHRTPQGQGRSLQLNTLSARVNHVRLGDCAGCGHDCPGPDVERWKLEPCATVCTARKGK